MASLQRNFKAHHKQCGIALGGTMPAFKEILSESEKQAVLAHVMSLWSDKTYEMWNKRNPL